MKWVSQGSITRQFDVIFWSVGALVLALGFAAALAFVRFEQRAERLADLTDVAFLTSGMDRDITSSKDNMGAYRARGYDPEAIALSIGSAENAMALNQELRVAAGALDQSWLPTINELDADLAQVKTMMEEVRDAPRDIVEKESFLGPRYDHVDTTKRKILSLSDDAAERAETASTDGLWEIRAAIIAMIVLVLMSGGLVFWARRFVAKRIVSPVAEISQTSARLVNGETDLQIPTYDRDDEIGEMSRSLHIMQAMAKESILQAEQTIEAQAERDDRIAQLQSIADTFETTVGQVATEVAATSGQLQSAAGVLTDNAEKSSQRVVKATDLLTETSDGVTGAASASDEFVMSISEISRQAASSADRARKAHETAEDADRTITDLDAMAGQVSTVVELISQIAQRTNLLALNASIEAARGGEAGRGFAVVAGEVKELAMQTAQATEEVEAQIRKIQSQSGAGASALREISAEVNELQSTSVAIASAVDQQSIAGSELAKSIDMAARNTEAVAVEMSEVSRMTVATGSAATQVLGSCNQLSEQADMLRKQVSDFLHHVRAA